MKAEVDLLMGMGVGLMGLDILYGKLRFKIINVYNKGPGCNGSAVTTLMDYETSWDVDTAIARDFNLHH